MQATVLAVLTIAIVVLVNVSVQQDDEARQHISDCVVSAAKAQHHADPYSRAAWDLYYSQCAIVDH